MAQSLILLTEVNLFSILKFILADFFLTNQTIELCIVCIPLLNFSEWKNFPSLLPLDGCKPWMEINRNQFFLLDKKIDKSLHFKQMNNVCVSNQLTIRNLCVSETFSENSSIQRTPNTALTKAYAVGHK